MATPLSPAPRFTAPLRPRYKTNPSQGVSNVRESGSATRQGSKDTGKGKPLDQSVHKPIRTVHAPIMPMDTADMVVDVLTPSLAIPNDMNEFPLPPQRSLHSNSGAASTEGHTATFRPLPPRPGPPPVSPLFVFWAPN